MSAATTFFRVARTAATRPSTYRAAAAAAPHDCTATTHIPVARATASHLPGARSGATRLPIAGVATFCRPPVCACATGLLLARTDASSVSNANGAASLLTRASAAATLISRSQIGTLRTRPSRRDPCLSTRALS